MKETAFTLFTCLLAGIAFGQNKTKDFDVFEGSVSPDGKYVMAWGIPYMPLNFSDMDGIFENANLEAVENYLVDVKRNEIVATLGTAYFPGKNHGGIEFFWKENSQSVLVTEGGKWGFLATTILHLEDIPGEFNQPGEAIPVTNAMRKAIQTEILKRHPEEKAAIENFVVDASPKAWTGPNQIKFEISGEVPKALDAFVFFGEMTLNLPGPNLVSVAGGGGEGKTPAPQTAATITPNSAGPIRLGMTVGDARRAMPNADFSRSSDGEGIALIDVKQGEDLLMSFYANEEDPDSKIDDQAVINFIDVWSPSFKTAEGIHPGMAINKAEEKIGKISEITTSEIEAREYGQFENQASGNHFRLSHPSGAAGKYPKNEMVTKSYEPDGFIWRIEVTGADIMMDEHIGGFSIGAPQDDVIAIANRRRYGKVVKEKDEMWEAFGQAVQTWNFPESGISLDMISDEIGGPKTVLSITAKAPFSRTTGSGVSLGDEKQKVVAAYADYKTEEEEMDGFFEGKDVHLVGSIYGGLILTFKNGQLSEMFLGAAAE